MTRKPLAPPPDLQSLFGQRVRQAREDQGLTQAALAAKSGIDSTYISRVELGKENLKLSTMTQLADALGLDLGAMLSRPSSRRTRN